MREIQSFFFKQNPIDGYLLTSFSYKPRINSFWPVRNFFLFEFDPPFSNEDNNFALFLNQVKTLFLGTTYLFATSLFHDPCSRSLIALNVSISVLFVSLGLHEDMLIH